MKEKGSGRRARRMGMDVIPRSRKLDLQFLRYDDETDEWTLQSGFDGDVAGETKHHLHHGRCRCGSSSGEDNRIPRTMSCRGDSKRHNQSDTETVSGLSFRVRFRLRI